MLNLRCRFVATTPPALTDDIASFCRQLSSEAPVYLEITPGSDATMALCYANVAAIQERQGGNRVFGWLIWELPGIYLTAEHHAVFEHDGSLIDVTPQMHGEKRVLFLPDRQTEFRLLPTANRYAALAPHPMLLRYVELARRNSALDVEGKTFGIEHQHNDQQMTRLVDAYLARTKHEPSSKDRRKKKKAERRRK